MAIAMYDQLVVGLYSLYGSLIVWEVMSHNENTIFNFKPS